jgi:hypothetical protein
MQINSVSRIHHPIEEVFRAYRDHMPELAAYVPDVKRIDVAQRREEGPVVRLHNVWHADREIPAMARRFVTRDMLRWDDFAAWDSERLVCDWQLRVHVFTEAIRCEGQNLLEPAGAGATDVRLVGELSVDLALVPGVPSVMARRMQPQVERFIVALITPNLQQVNAAVGRFLDERG